MPDSDSQLDEQVPRDDGDADIDRNAEALDIRPSDIRPSDGRWLLLVVAITLAVRLTFLMMMWGNLQQDPDHYGLIARNLVERGSFSRIERPDRPADPTAFRPPLYPLLLTLTVHQARVQPVLVAVLHLGLAVITTLAVFWLGRFLLGSVPLATLAAMAVAVDPILLHQSTMVMTETLATMLAVISWLAVARSAIRNGATRKRVDRSPRAWAWMFGAWMFGAGVLLGLTVLARPTFLIWAASCVVALAFWPHQSPTRVTWRARLVHAAILALGIGLALAPWCLRNWMVMGKPILATTHGGYTLLLGNNAEFYRHLREAPAGTVWDSRDLDAHRIERFRALDRNEILADQDAWEEAKVAIRRDPAGFLWSSAVRLGRLWRPWPHQLTADESPTRKLSRYVVGAWYIPWFALALVGLYWIFSEIFRRRIEPKLATWCLGLLLVGTFSAVHAFFWSNLRMRAPLMPAVYLAAAAGWSLLWAHFRRSLREPEKN